MNLKTLLLTWLTALSLNILKAQAVQDTTAKDVVTALKQDSLQKKSTADTINPFRITSGYAGQVAALWFSTKDASDVTLRSSTRLWWWAAYDITKNTSLNVWSVIDISPKDWESFAFWQAFIKSQLWKELIINGWLIATPATMIRPFPVNSIGHFETSTDMLIPGGAPWVRFDRPWNVNGSLWVAIRKWTPEYGINIWYKASDMKVNVATWIQDEEVFGAVLSWSYKTFSWTFVLNQTSEKSLLGSKLLYTINIPWREWSLILFSVMNVDRNVPKDQMLNSLHWVLAAGKVDINGMPVDIVIWPWYDWVNKRIALYLQLALQR